ARDWLSLGASLSALHRITAQRTAGRLAARARHRHIHYNRQPSPAIEAEIADFASRANCRTSVLRVCLVIELWHDLLRPPRPVLLMLVQRRATAAAGADVCAKSAPGRFRRADRRGDDACAAAS